MDLNRYHHFHYASERTKNDTTTTSNRRPYVFIAKLRLKVPATALFTLYVTSRTLPTELLSNLYKQTNKQTNNHRVKCDERGKITETRYVTKLQVNRC